MTLRQHRFLIGLCCVAGSLLVSLALQNIPPSLGWNAAHASVFQAAPVDPVANPGGFLSQLLSFAHTSWPIAVLLGMYGLLEVSVALGKNVPLLAWLDKGRITLVLAGATSVLSATLLALLNGGSTQSALIAAVGALLALWHPQAQAVAEKKAA